MRRCLQIHCRPPPRFRPQVFQVGSVGRVFNGTRSIMQRLAVDSPAAASDVHFNFFTKTLPQAPSPTWTPGKPCPPVPFLNIYLNPPRNCRD